MKEYFDIITKDGKETGIKKERNAVHTDGDWHKSVHIWAKENNKILFQKRKDDKESFPSCYDAACTGHVDAGETYLQAAIREVKEEIGLEIDEKNLLPVCKKHFCVDENFNGKKFISNELTQIYLLKDCDFSNLSFQEEEISELKWFSVEELKKIINGKNFCASYSEFKELLNFAEKNNI